MSQIGNIAINDGKSTPATHTFVPQSTDPAVYRNGASESSIYGIINDETIRVTAKVNPTGISKVDIQLKTPHLDANGQHYYESANVTFLSQGTATPDQRKDSRVLLANLLLNSQIADAVDQLNPPY